jgi:hypothetical protein
MEVSGQFTSQSLYPQGKNPWYPMARRLGGPQAGLDMVVKRKISSPFWDLNSLIFQTIAQYYTTEL